MQTDTLWFKDDGQLTKVLCEGGKPKCQLNK